MAVVVIIPSLQNWIRTGEIGEGEVGERTEGSHEGIGRRMVHEERKGR